MQDLHSIYSSLEGRYHHPLNLLNPVNPLNPHTEGVSKASFLMGGAFHHMQLPAEGDTQFRCFGLAEMEVIIAPLHAVHALGVCLCVIKKQ